MELNNIHFASMSKKLKNLGKDETVAGRASAPCQQSEPVSKQTPCKSVTGPVAPASIFWAEKQ